MQPQEVYVKRERSKPSKPKAAGNIKYDLVSPVPWDGDGDPGLARDIRLVAERYQSAEMAKKGSDVFGYKIVVYGFPSTGGWMGTKLKACLSIFDAPFVMFDERLVPVMDGVEEYLDADPEAVWAKAHEAAVKAAEALRAASAPAPAATPKRRQRTIVKT